MSNPKNRDRLTRALLTLAGFVVGTATALAQPKGSEHVEPALKALVPPRDRTAICFARTYDAQHLVSHPHQRVARVSFGVAVEHLREEDKYRYNFAMRTKLNGRGRMLTTEGECGWAYSPNAPSQSRTIRCNVECDGGGVTVERDERTGDLLVRLANMGEDRKLYGEGGIRMSRGCGEENTVVVEPGRDDRIFRLTRAPLDQCWPGEHAYREASP